MKIPKRILVIDDDCGNNLVCKVIIKNIFGDVEVRTFTEPQQGIAFIQTEYSKEHDAGSLLLLDINMPEMTGWEVLDVLETFNDRIHRQLDICILSSSIDPNDKEKAMARRSVKAYLEKPLLKDELMRALSAAG